MNKIQVINRVIWYPLFGEYRKDLTANQPYPACPPELLETKNRAKRKLLLVNLSLILISHYSSIWNPSLKMVPTWIWSSSGI